ncbi:MAG: hypothetical protein SV429_02340 [Pseudomonadota bacterium]|nr:hypothetical protein [Pseudomonadota bacterium]
MTALALSGVGAQAENIAVGVMVFVAVLIASINVGAASGSPIACSMVASTASPTAAEDPGSPVAGMRAFLVCCSSCLALTHQGCGPA